MRAQTVYKKAYVFDLDDTLIKSSAVIRVYSSKGVLKKTMTPKEYNFYKPVPGENLDFNDFLDGDIILNAKKYTMWPVLQKVSNAIKQERSTSVIYILTARDKTMRAYIYEFLKKNGIEIALDHIICIGDGIGKINIADEKRKILKKLASKYDKIMLFDDNPETIQLASGIKNIFAKLVESYHEK